MGRPIEHWDDWLVTIVTRRLDKGTAQSWQHHQRNSDLPKYSDLEKFLASRCAAIERSEADTQRSSEAMINSFNTRELKRASVKKSLAIIEKPENKCICCDGFHKIFACEKFKAMPVSDRLSRVREARRCFNCLSPYHGVSNCESTNYRQICKMRHNTLLHYQKANETKIPKERHNDGVSEEQLCKSSSLDKNVPPLHSCIAAESATNHVFLATASILIADNRGEFKKCCAVLDSGSQINFISKKLANFLQLPRKKTTLPVSSIGASSTYSVSSITVKIRSRVGNFDTNLVCHVLPVVVERLPPCETPINGWRIPEEYQSQLADPEFGKEKNIDLLIVGGIFFDLLGSKKISLQEGGLKLQETVLGWIVTGEVGVISLPSVITMGNSLEEIWRSLKEKENLLYGRKSKINLKLIEKKQTIEHFKNHTTRDNDGRFIISLPLKSSVEELGDTLKLATNRFLSVERRLFLDNKLQGEYIEFMEEYITLGHMQEVKNEIIIPKRVFYLPHHAVVKESSLTTKVRIVFDASAKSSTGISLNEVLMSGPNIQEDVFSILTRFRRHQYALTSDVEKMFGQVAVSEADWDLQRIVWRPNPSEPLRTFCLTTVTYRTTPASFLATQCLVTLAEIVKNEYPKAAQVMGRDFYMDDLMTGADDEEECSKLQHEVSEILNSAKFKLRKWCSNSMSVLKHIDNVEDDPLFTLEIRNGSTVKSLGLNWKPLADQFHFNISINSMLNKCTKRTLLSDLNRVFDPLGFLSPVLLRGKIFLQQIWSMKVGWDTQLSADVQQKWLLYKKELQELKVLSIPRKVKPISDHIPEMHGFCDASHEAYGACIYVRTMNNQGKWTSQLLCAKTRITPLKEWTIPRLELSGELLLAELGKKVAESWGIELRAFNLWTDSTIVLGWLNSQSVRLKTFVSNRVNQILDLTDANQWRHVRTEEIPADWRNGPSWLEKRKQNWESELVSPIREEELPEIRPVRLALVTINSDKDLLLLYSNWTRLVRAIAWLRKFIEYKRKKDNVLSRYLSMQDLSRAECVLIKRAQLDEFEEEHQALTEEKEVSRRSKLKGLYPMLNNNGLILVGGRLNNALMSENQKHPIILPSNPKVTRLIFENKHKKMLHCGPQALLAEVRRQYWPLRRRAVARSSVLKCVRCVRARPRFIEPIMAALPKSRVQSTNPFSVTGVDFAGPLIIRSGVRRVVGIKAWIAVFVCFVTRAVHLEAVEDLTSKAFIAALRRFMARRCHCSIIYCDNGTNFVGAQRELRSYVEKAGSLMAQEGIEWRFNPPSAPHFGGLWEAAVKSAKYHLTRMTGEARLSLSELSTLLYQIEACLNSRPLTPMSNDPSDAEALTPAHFLFGREMSLPPEPDLSSVSLSQVRRWKYVQLLMQTFWRRWQMEYLPQFQARGKWIKRTAPIQIGNIVIIKDECMPPTKWKLGIVVNVHPVKDGEIRVVTLRTAGGVQLKRPTVKLCVLPTESDSVTVENDDFQRGENVEADGSEM